MIQRPGRTCLGRMWSWDCFFLYDSCPGTRMPRSHHLKTKTRCVYGLSHSANAADIVTRARYREGYLPRCQPETSQLGPATPFKPSGCPDSCTSTQSLTWPFQSLILTSRMPTTTTRTSSPSTNLPPPIPPSGPSPPAAPPLLMVGSRSAPPPSDSNVLFSRCCRR